MTCLPAASPGCGLLIISKIQRPVHADECYDLTVSIFVWQPV